MRSFVLAVLGAMFRGAGRGGLLMLAVGGLLLGAASVMFGRGPSEAVLFGLGLFAVVGLLFGAGLGAAVGAAQAGCPADDDPRGPIVARWRTRTWSDACREPGLSWLDLAVSLLHGLTLTAFGLAALMILFGGGRRLVLALMEFIPGAPGGLQSRVMLFGTCLVLGAMPVLVQRSRRPPTRRVRAGDARSLAISGFFAGVTWPPVLPFFLG